MSPSRTPPSAGDRPPLLLLLHGVGANELAMAGLASSFDPRFVIISVRAAHTIGHFAYGWFHVTFTPAGPVIDGDEARQAWTQFHAFVDEAVIAYGADSQRVFVVGFSQGGIVALAAMLTAPERFAGVACMSGRLPHEVLPHIVVGDRLRDRPVLVLHGVRDDVLEIAFARRARVVLAALPVDLSYHELDLGHSTSESSIGIVARWLTAQLDRATRRPAR